MRTCVCVCVCVLLQMLFIVFFLLLLGEKKRETKDVNRAPNIREKKKNVDQQYLLLAITM